MKPFLALAILAVLVLGSSCSSDATAPTNVVARVNDVDITSEDLDKEFESRVQGADPAPSEEEIEDLKLQLLGELINNEVLLQLAGEAALTATDAEVDVQFNEFKSQFTEERFQELLDEQKLTTTDLREQMRTQLTIEKLVNKEITSKISVSEIEIEDFFNKNKESFNLPETFRLAHVLITPVEEPEVTNTEGDDAKTPAEASAKAQRLLRQIQGGGDFATLARQLSEDPASAPLGGDLNFQPIDAIGGVDPAMADAAIQMRVGETYPRVVETRFGYHILKLLEKDAGGQKDLTDPRVQAQIRQVIFDRKDQMLKGAFFEIARNNSSIQNFLARRILERAGGTS